MPHNEPLFGQVDGLVATTPDHFKSTIKPKIEQSPKDLHQLHLEFRLLFPVKISKLALSMTKSPSHVSTPDLLRAGSRFPICPGGLRPATRSDR